MREAALANNAEFRVHGYGPGLGHERGALDRPEWELVYPDPSTLSW
jgi:hypothetical protein